jgi:bifunctional non-homologous end joining protein LigD
VVYTTVVRYASFIEPMECLPVWEIPEGPQWVYEVKLDGFRAIGVIPKQGKPRLFSRRGLSFDRKFPDVAKTLATLPRGTVIDGEIVALDDAGRPDFHLLTHSRCSADRIFFYVFDLLYLENKNIMALPLVKRRDMLKSLVFESANIRHFEYFQTSASDMLDMVREHSLEGVVAKRIDSRYEPGRRTGAWVKHRIAQQDDFLIGGYIPGSRGIDSLIVGEYRGNRLLYAGRVRAGLVPASRREVFEKLHPLVTGKCPFANLPELGKGRWGAGLTAEKMKQCVWVKPKVIARIGFLERTASGGLRHARYGGIKD